MSVEESLRQELLSKQKEMERLRERLSEAERALAALRENQGGIFPSHNPRKLENPLTDLLQSEATADGIVAETNDSAVRWEITGAGRNRLSVESDMVNAILMHMPSGVIVEDARSGRIILANGQAEEIWRHSFTGSPEIDHHGLFKGVHPDGRPYEPEEWPLARSIRSGEVVTDQEIRFYRGDGTPGTMSASSCPVRDGEGRITGAVMVFHDLTGIRMMEETLRRSEEECRLIFDDAPIGAAIVGLDYRYELVNEALCAVTGYSKEELMSLYVTDITHPDDLEEVIDLSRRLYSGEIDHFQIEKRDIRKDGRTVWANIHVRLLREADGRSLYYLMMVEDITERWQAEESLRKAHEELEHRVRERTAQLSRMNEDLKRYAEKMELANQELREFAFVASHHLQEPLRKIQVIGNLVGMRYTDTLDEEGKAYLGRMINSAGRMQELIQDLFQYTQVGTKSEPFHAVSLSAPAREAAEELIQLVRKTGADVQIREMPVAEVRPFQIRKLFHVLISNALKFHGGKQPVVRVYGKDTLDGSCQVFIEDNGIGFDEVYLDRIFRPFQRLHGDDVYSGTGIGLAICRKIVERHSGNITARSSPGKGTTFIVTLPIKHRQDELESEEPIQGNERELMNGISTA
jgi:PAS domain S-box-containing protein